MRVAIIGGAKASILMFLRKEYYLLYNGNAMFTLQDQYGPDFYSGIAENRKMLIDVTVLLAEQGELARRFVGLDAREVLTVETINTLGSPMDHIAMMQACNDALTLGINREIQDEDDEIDLGLIELQKKKRLSRAEYVKLGLVSHLSMMETLMANPGYVYDLVELLNRAHEKRKENM